MGGKPGFRLRLQTGVCVLRFDHQMPHDLKGETVERWTIREVTRYCVENNLNVIETIRALLLAVPLETETRSCQEGSLAAPA